MRTHLHIISLILMAGITSACGGGSDSPEPTTPPTSTETPTPSPTPTSTPTPTPAVQLPPVSLDVEAETTTLLGAAIIDDDANASGGSKVSNLTANGDGISLNLTEPARSLSLRYQSATAATLTIELNDVILGNIQLENSQGEYAYAIFNGTFPANASLTIVRREGDGAADIDSISLNRFSSETQAFTSISTIFDYQEAPDGVEFGDSLIVDDEENIYISGGQNNGVVVQLTATDESNIYLNNLNLPVGMAFDSLGNFYVSDCGANLIGKVDTEGNYSTFANVSTCPASIVINSLDELFVTTFFNNTIAKISPEGVVTTVVSDSKLNNPVGLTLDEDENLYVANWQGGQLFRIVDDELVELANFDTRVNQIAYHEGYIYVPQRLEHIVERVSLTGVVETFVGDGVAGSDDGAINIARVNAPYGVAISPDGNALYIVERIPGRVRQVTRD